MNEKNIIKSRHDKLLFAFCGIPFAIGLAFTIGVFCDGGPSAWVDYAARGLLCIEALFSWGGLILLIIGVVVFLASKDCEICVTDKRAFGKSTFGNRVDIPLDSISAVAIKGWKREVSISSSSGSVRFPFIANYYEIHQTVSELLMSRNTAVSHAENTINADELKQYKDLFDSGVISQEEFEAKKKQLLGL
ncbi:MAG: SHOCT domain-containing protein [Oscillospiraceae bacterium]|nr:SHOCT domain-containing protein [Oscillospiraceae bacterium]MCD8374755.1 SHOCT domain-containing protein [Oscillospiraceae bacterium]